MKRVIKESFSKIDFIVWFLTLAFFLASSFFMGGDIYKSYTGASGIIVLMFLVGLSIELILSSLRNVKGIGKITGFITNGPEALVLFVGLISGNIIFAASTPLGSNIMNPILLFIALLLSGYLFRLRFFSYKLFFIFGFILTSLLAISFFQIPSSYYIYWLGISLIITVPLFLKKFDGAESEETDSDSKWYYLPLGLILLVSTGYFLDPVVSFTAESSKASKGLIGFLVLSTLTSWPEFKSVLSLLQKGKTLDAFVNILVSNLTNIWLAMLGIIIWVFSKMNF